MFFYDASCCIIPEKTEIPTVDDVNILALNVRTSCAASITGVYEIPTLLMASGITRRTISLPGKGTTRSEADADTACVQSPRAVQNVQNAPLTPFFLSITQVATLSVRIASEKSVISRLPT